jgi:hypothetical protein
VWALAIHPGLLGGHLIGRAIQDWKQAEREVRTIETKAEVLHPAHTMWKDRRCASGTAESMKMNIKCDPINVINAFQAHWEAE